MILRRLIHSLRTQNWTAIGIELMIVIIGVFVGTQVANWNEQRLEKRQTERMLEQLQPELHSQLEFYQNARDYYGTTRGYATTAFAAWDGSKQVPDNEFVIAAYQASQVMGIGINVQSLAIVVGGDDLRQLADPELRRRLSSFMSGSLSTVDTPAVATKYREDVRRLIPDPVQAAIRARCGDRGDPDNPLLTILPKSCALKLPPDQAAKAAAALRAHPELADELRWHRAAVATFLQNADEFERQTLDLSKRIDALN